MSNQQYGRYQKGEVSSLAERHGLTKRRIYQLKKEGHDWRAETPQEMKPPEPTPIRVPTTPGELACEKVKIAMGYVETAALIFTASTFDAIGIRGRVQPIKERLDGIASELQALGREIKQ